MAEEAKEKEAAAPVAKAPSKLPWILLGVVVVAGGGGTMFMLNKKGEAGHAAVAKPPEIGPLLALEPFIVNLNEPGGNRYLKTAMDVELKEPLPEEATKLMPRLRDKIISFLSAHSVAEMQRPETREAVKKHVIDSTNEVFDAKIAKAVYFKELVMQ